MPTFFPVESHDGELIKWAQMEPGSVLEGEYAGTHEGQYGPIVDLLTADGVKAIPMKTALQRQLERVKCGATIQIRFDGLQRAKSGRDFYACKVFIADKSDMLPAPPRQHDDDGRLF